MELSLYANTQPVENCSTLKISYLQWGGGLGSWPVQGISPNLCTVGCNGCFVWRWKSVWRSYNRGMLFCSVCLRPAGSYCNC